MKELIKYIVIFFITLIILFGLLVITAKIPREFISNNIKESTSEFHTSSEIDKVVIKREYTYRHIYADAMLLNIIYCIDSSKPVQSVMEAKYYSELKEKINSKYENEVVNKSISYDFNELVDGEHEGNQQYIRYWHGSMSIIRPLLVFLNLKQIYILNFIIISILTIILLIMLIKTKIKELVIAFVISLIMCFVIIVPFCLEYTWTYMIMLVASIIALILEKKGRKLNILFFITGIVTCYLDFLSTELLTFMIPILLILVIRYKQNRLTNFKDGLKFMVISSVLWGIGYVGMWFAKWILASIILKINAFDYVIDNAIERINGGNNAIVKIDNMYINAIVDNLLTLFPINIQKRVERLYFIPIVIIIFVLIFIKKKNWRELWFPALLIIIALIPYIRYLILADHSYRHYFFTFRLQMISIIALILAVVYSIDRNIANYKIKLNVLKKKNEKKEYIEK